LNFSQKDIQQIEEKGLSVEKVEDQIENFKRGNVDLDILAAATVWDGIFLYSEQEKYEYISYYEKQKTKLEILKFVPASGAATRMFKDLQVFLEEFKPQSESLPEYLKRTNNTNLKLFLDNLEKLPFYERALNNARENQPGFDELNRHARKILLVQTILYSHGLGLSNFPKGLVPFHNYEDYVATAFEEHFYEAAKYAEANGKANLHFTISEEHKEKFEAEYDDIKSRVTKKTGVTFKVSYSYQDPKTDTIAVDLNNKPFRSEEGEMFFRPGGHGALIENLNNQEADLVFIKNIDNVVIASKLDEVAEYKKILAGKLLKVQEQCFSYLNSLELQKPSEKNIQGILQFIENELFYSFPEDFDLLSDENKIQQLKFRLNRPLRICGMVKNEGEPGGGPFLLRMKNGEQSIQIIEGAQIDQNDLLQKEIAKNSTHFNPVDIVCGLRNYKGEAFDLTEFIDPETSFITSKTVDGKAIKALELPGLWNGAMAKWNSVFVEVPVNTFNPVKTVMDLLKPSHQPS
jgi:hypothetical protein